jgi:nucleotide sugar dehydrogenase|tara:strand:- start:1013 stop:2113 length:1101 start_codon:yes stop_codon:yes gene_type:complete
MKNISVIGVGKLGLCFSLTLEKAGYNIVGVDVNRKYVESLNNKTFTSSEPSVDKYLQESENFTATTSLKSAVDHSDILFVIVATPSLKNGRYDHKQVDSLINSLEMLKTSSTRKHFVVCCTTMPGFCDSIKEKMLDLNYEVSYNPEFIAQGTIIKNQAQPDMVLIGESSIEGGDILEEIYTSHTTNMPRICRMTPTEAEITKIALNCFLTTKIAYANMVGDIVKSSGGDPNVVLNAVGQDTRIGNKYLGYGFGYGGPCFPRDNRALAIYAKDIGIEALISLASDESNSKHLDYQIKEYVENSDQNTEVVFDYVTYKPESTLLVESQQLAFAAGIAKEGIRVRIRERAEVIEQLKEKYGNFFEYEER